MVLDFHVLYRTPLNLFACGSPRTAFCICALSGANSEQVSDRPKGDTLATAEAYQSWTNGRQGKDRPS